MKLVIYSVLTGDGERLGDPTCSILDSRTDLDLAFVCFSDKQRDAVWPWEIRVFDAQALPPRTSSRFPKTSPHRFLKDYQFSLYIDNTVRFKRLPKSEDLFHEGDYLYSLFKHSGRSNVLEEALAVAFLNYEKSSNIADLLDEYSAHFPPTEIYPLSTCTCIFREHNHPTVIHHGEIWWTHILRFSQRDQLSFDFCRLLTKLEVTYLSGTKHTNDLVHSQENFSDARELASDTRRVSRTLAYFEMFTERDSFSRSLKSDLTAYTQARLYTSGSPLARDRNVLSNFDFYCSTLFQRHANDFEFFIVNTKLASQGPISLLSPSSFGLGSIARTTKVASESSNRISTSLSHASVVAVLPEVSEAELLLETFKNYRFSASIYFFILVRGGDLHARSALDTILITAVNFGISARFVNVKDIGCDFVIYEYAFFNRVT